MVSDIVEVIVEAVLEWGTQSSRRAVRWGCTALLVLICVALLALALGAAIS
jgi:hypothetical protein